ncbi:hypothetical protein ACSSS7_005153 [Eimeria intestinalis]
MEAQFWHVSHTFVSPPPTRLRLRQQPVVPQATREADDCFVLDGVPRAQCPQGHCSATVFAIFFLLTAASAALLRSSRGAAATVLSSSYGTLFCGERTAARTLCADIKSPPFIPTERTSSCRLSRQRRQPLSFLSSWTSAPQDFSEATFCGEWHFQGQLHEAAARKEADAAADLVRKAGGPEAAAAFLRMWEALLGGNAVSVDLSSDRQAAIRICSCHGVLPPFSFRGIWQVRGRPFLRPLLEIEFAFPSDSPAVILVISTPLRSGTYIPAVPLTGEGEISLAFSPFLPWKVVKIGKAELSPKTNKPTVDVLFN